MTEKKRLEIRFSHPNALNVMKILVQSDRITSVLSMGEVGVEVGIHDVSNHDLLQLIRTAQAELTTRGFSAAVSGAAAIKAEADAIRLDAINKANAASGLPPVSMS